MEDNGLCKNDYSDTSSIGINHWVLDQPQFDL